VFLHEVFYVALVFLLHDKEYEAVYELQPVCDHAYLITVRMRNCVNYFDPVFYRVIFKHGFHTWFFDQAMNFVIIVIHFEYQSKSSISKLLNVGLSTRKQLEFCFIIVDVVLLPEYFIDLCVWNANFIINWFSIRSLIKDCIIGLDNILIENFDYCSCVIFFIFDIIFVANYKFVRFVFFIENLLGILSLTNKNY